MQIGTYPNNLNAEDALIFASNSTYIGVEHRKSAVIKYKNEIQNISITETKFKINKNTVK